MPSTNNNIESLNNHFKTDVTSFLKLPIGELFKKLFDHIYNIENE